MIDKATTINQTIAMVEKCPRITSLVPRIDAVSFLITCQLDVTLAGEPVTIQAIKHPKTGRMSIVCPNCGRQRRYIYYGPYGIGCKVCLRLRTYNMYRLSDVIARIAEHEADLADYQRVINDGRIKKKKRLAQLKKKQDKLMLQKICHLIKNPPKSAG